ncbi:MAG: AAC(3) family N-acetyltransferase, partial [Eubacteriales bacterium]|nr:AAC(3) family N-acetyltransferase [Eubacteriales bacterium]
MSEESVIRATQKPATEKTLLADLRALGVKRGDTLIVHSAMSSLGWVCGREVAVIHALLAAVGPAGTLVMPAHAGDNSEPSAWGNPPAPESWWQVIRDETPAFDRTWPTRGMGRIPEAFRAWPGARRSAHPHVSWCARGPFAGWLLRGHTFGKPCFGPQSPLGRMYRR